MSSELILTQWEYDIGIVGLNDIPQLQLQQIQTENRLQDAAYEQIYSNSGESILK